MKIEDDAGFSLIELLISLVLVAVIAVGLLSTTRAGIRLLDRSATLGDHADEIALRARLRFWLAHATHPGPEIGSDAVFAGDASGFSFVTASAGDFAVDRGAARVTVIMADSALKIRLDWPDDVETPRSLERIILRNAMNVSFSYFYRNRDEGTWMDDWSGRSDLPLAVRIVADPGSQPDWPDFTVRLVSAR